jgi:hypothetical protein
MVPHPWRGASAAIATKHGKHRQFGPPFHQMTGVDVTLAAVDTDRLGTFSGEVPREGSPLDSGRRKAQWAIDHSGARIGLGSEGSFGPHPDTPFLVVGLELVVCLDARDDLEVVERIMSVDTNFRHLDLTALPLPQGFLDAVGFPAHALVVAPPDEWEPMFKGLQDLAAVEDAVVRCLEVGGVARLQADMRAHLNPTRQRELTGLAERLARRLCQFCPACSAPGWGLVDVERGLPCEWCAYPTPLVAAEVFGCARRGCNEQRRHPRTTLASAGRCPMCNP